MRNLGFTLLEMLIVVALTAIMLLLAAPSMNYSSTTTSLDAIAKSIDKDIALARSQAISSGRYVTMCLSDSSFTCTTSSPASHIVFTDINSDGIYDTSDKVVAKDILNSDRFTITASNSSFMFDTTGKPSIAGTISFCPNDTSITQGYLITLLLTGAHVLTTKTC